jgi:hypothetical protein
LNLWLKLHHNHAVWIYFGSSSETPVISSLHCPGCSVVFSKLSCVMLENVSNMQFSMPYLHCALNNGEVK